MHPGRRSLFLKPRIDFDSILRSEAQIGEAKKSANTRAAYSLAWRSFCSWCEVAQVSPLPAEPRVVKNFATWCFEHGYRIRTVTLRLTGIAHYHREAGLPSPIAKDVWRHIGNAAIMQRTGHKCSSTLRRYIRPASVFDFNPLKGVL